MTPLANALNAKNVQIHGMQTSKWTTRDKITQYKGLVSLYKRDREITQIDASVNEKRQYKELINLRKIIDDNRKVVNEAEAGDRMQLRNTLRDHRRLQLAYQNSPPKEVTEELSQINFSKRKVLDKLEYALNQKSQELIDLKLQEALLQDRLKYECLNKLKDEEVAQSITGKVQDALLKKEAALAIQQTYVQIIDVMKKDTLYFDGILSTIQNDYWYQCRCVLNATKQGQLATEYKHDREQEYQSLEDAVLLDMKTRKEDLERLRKQNQRVQNDMKLLLRRDSDLTTCVVEVDEPADFKQLRNDLSKIEASLNYLKNKTLVSSFELIYPNLCEQLRQKKRLEHLAKKCKRNKEIMLNKLNHAELMISVLDTTMIETTGEYKKRKTELLDLINEETKKINEFNHLKMIRQNLIAKIRIALRQLQQLCKPIKLAGKAEAHQERDCLTMGISVEDMAPPEPEETEALKIIQSLTPQLTYLIANCRVLKDPNQLDTAFKYYEILMKQNSIGLEPEIKVQASLLEGLTTEVTHLLTREDIKKRSERIVAASTKEDEPTALPPTKNKRT